MTWRLERLAFAAVSLVLLGGTFSCTAGIKSEADAGLPPTGTAADGGSQPAPDAGLQTATDTAVERPTDPGPTNCQNLCKQQMTCAGGATTSLSGTVHAPTPAKLGTADPLYNVLVYVPNAPVAKFTPGVACQRCEKASGSPLVSAITGADGKFQLRNVPVGNNIPLVIQVGRWRRQVTIPAVAACTDTALPDELTRLPRNQQEGDIPAIAVATGIYDPFDCTLRKVGIDEAEFTVSTANGRVNLWSYGGHDVAGMTTPSATDMFTDPAALAKYDLVILPCNDGDDSDPTVQANLADYANKGGRIFLTDLSNAWLHDGKSFESAVTWLPFETTLGYDFTVTIDATFPKGMAFSDWMTNVGAASPMPGQLPIHDPYGGGSLVSAVVAPTQRWLYTSARRATVQTFTFNTPVGTPDAQQCGRVVFSQFHVASEANADNFDTGTFPTSCDDQPMTPQEKALEFMLFDLSSCIQADAAPVVIP
ncbi:MAG TPA: carboxypeptidase regulatory-like domain-containing protein [Polyangia bacterium]|nr:carboxypeptidase regulatory-like domain-containing protein [Polyangia bacterium]